MFIYSPPNFFFFGIKAYECLISIIKSNSVTFKPKNERLVLTFPNTIN